MLFPDPILCVLCRLLVDLAMCCSGPVGRAGGGRREEEVVEITELS